MQHEGNLALFLFYTFVLCYALSTMESHKPKRELSEAGEREWEMKEMAERHAKELDAQQGLHEWEMEEQLGVDRLTGAKSLAAFESALKRSLKMIREHHRKGEEAPKETSLIYIDLDHFKRINDTYGHAMGDEVLRKVVATLKKSLVRGTDLVARIGGEELAVLLPGADIEFAKNDAEKFRREIEKIQFDTDPKLPKLVVTASFGVISSKSSTDEAFLRKGADTTLYAAKHGGRNRVEVYNGA